MIKFFKVGGCVRDKILGHHTTDIDYAVEAPSFQHMKDEVLDLGGEIYMENPEFLTLRANVATMGGACDFVLCRKDGQYTDGRRPDEVEPGTLMDDLARRDFTMNALAIDEDGHVIDAFNGIDHMRQKCIHAVGSAQQKFSEDYLRILRAIRFAVTKNMALSNEISDAIVDLRAQVSTVSTDRIRKEMLKAFAFDTPRTIRVLQQFQLVDILFAATPLWLKPTVEDK